MQMLKHITVRKASEWNFTQFLRYSVCKPPKYVSKIPVHTFVQTRDNLQIAKFRHDFFYLARI